MNYDWILKKNTLIFEFDLNAYCKDLFYFIVLMDKASTYN